MNVDLRVVGREVGPVEVTWTETDAMLYALGVGAGQADPAAELDLTTENTQGVEVRTVPSFGVVIVQRARLHPQRDIAPGALSLHASQSVTLEQPLPVSGTVSVTSRVRDVLDKGTGALVITDSVAADRSGHIVLRTESVSFLRGAGGFSGSRGPKSAWTCPGRPPDHVERFFIPAGQALLYRLSGDRNPLHSDPGVSSRAGYQRPILHGMCTFGYACRILGRALARGTRMREMSARFTAPVYPGSDLIVEAWEENNTAQFRMRDADGQIVLDHGIAGFTRDLPEPGSAQ
jgi:acyl dehydratase